MAGPHVAGAVALLWSADPSLIGDIDRTEQLLIQTADPYTGQYGWSVVLQAMSPMPRMVMGFWMCMRR